MNEKERERSKLNKRVVKQRKKIEIEFEGIMYLQINDVWYCSALTYNTKESKSVPTKHINAVLLLLLSLLSFYFFGFASSVDMHYAVPIQQKMRDRSNGQ